jgi:regulator of protease activity HflC (stomatin/prohibitin superfamily)
MANPLPTILFVILAALSWFASGVQADPATGWWKFLLGIGISGFLSSALRVAAQWEKVIVFRLGKFHALKGPGIFTVLPFFDTTRRVDTRITTLDIPTQQAITKDNVPVSLDGVIFLRVDNPANAIIQVQNFQSAIRQYAQTALRDVVGSVTLDEILADREALGERIEKMVESETSGWGLQIAGIRIQDIVLPEDLKRVMARQAAAEREKRANITKSEGDREAAENLAAAAREMATAPGALQLRTLQSLDTLGNSAANTVVLAIPIDVVNALQAVPKMVENRNQNVSPQPAVDPVVAPLNANALGGLLQSTKRDESAESTVSENA